MQPTVDDNESTRHLQLAEAALARGDRAAALVALEAAWRLDSSDDQLPLTAGLLYLEEGEPLRAAELALDAIGTRPFNPAAMNLLAVACLDASRPELACSVLERTLRMAPGFDRAQRNLRTAKSRAGGGRQSKKRSKREHERFPADAIEELLAAPDTPTLCASVLLRDGGQTSLKACLSSLRPIAAEILVVDARSDRKSLGIETDPIVTLVAAAEGPETARTRNLGLSHARSDWILMLEADETLDAEAAATLRRAMGDAEFFCYLVDLHDADTGRRRRAVRLVRNAAGICFHDGLGDNLLPSLIPLEANWGLGIGESPATVSCTRTRRAVEPLPVDAKQLDGYLAHESLKTYALICKARVALEAGETEESLEHVRQARRLIDAVPYRRRALELEEPTLLEGRCLMRLERFDELASLIGEYHARFSTTAGTLFLEGLAAKARKGSARAVELLRKAVDATGQPTYSEPPPEVLGPALPNLLGASLIDAGDLEGANPAFRSALALRADNLEARLGLVALLHVEGRVQEVLEELDRLVDSHGTDRRMWIAGDMLLGELPALATPALGWLEEARRRFPDDAELLRRLCEAQLRAGGAEAAMANLDRLGDDAGSLRVTRMAAALAAGKSVDPVEPEHVEPAVCGLLSWFRLWLIFGAYEALDRALLDIDRTERVLPGIAGRTAELLDREGQPEAAEGVRSRLGAGSVAAVP